MSLPICDKCAEGTILPGEPSGSMQYGETAYFAAAAPDSQSSKSAVVLITDIFGLPLVNCKIMADRFAKEVGCDVWVPDLFNGVSCFKSSQQRADDFGRKPSFRRQRDG